MYLWFVTCTSLSVVLTVCGDQFSQEPLLDPSMKQMVLSQANTVAIQFANIVFPPVEPIA